jgi:hypothetical protein
MSSSPGYARAMSHQQWTPPERKPPSSAKVIGVTLAVIFGGLYFLYQVQTRLGWF